MTPLDPYEELVYQCVRVCCNDITTDNILRNSPPASVLETVENVVNEAVMRMDGASIRYVAAHIPHSPESLDRYRTLTEIAPQGGESPEMECVRHNLVASLFADTWPAARSATARAVEAFLTGVRRIVVQVSPRRGLRFHDIELPSKRP